MYTIIKLSLSMLVIHGICASELHPRVFDGKEIRKGAHKYLVELLIYNDNSISYSKCSGSILNQRWIISAAHCFSDDFIYVEVLKLQKQILGLVEKKQITLLPGFKFENPANYSVLEKDLALLKTTKSMSFDSFTQPIQVSTRSPKIGEAVVIAGYGDAENGVNVPREGQTIVAECGSTKTSLICTQSTVRAGNGDSGGPLVSRGRLVGVTSASCENVEIHQVCMTVYVNVALHSTWIKEVMTSRNLL